MAHLIQISIKISLLIKKRKPLYWSYPIMLHPFLSFWLQINHLISAFIHLVHFLCFSGLVAIWRLWHRAWQKRLFQLLLLLRHLLQFFPNIFITPYPFRFHVGHRHPLILASWAVIAWEGETLTRAGPDRSLATVSPTSVSLSCHTSRQSTTSQSPWTCWTHSRTRGCCGCVLCDAVTCLPVLILLTITPPPPSFSLLLSST